MSNRWVLLRDADSSVILQHLETRERREVSSSSLEEEGAYSIRGDVVETTDDATYRSTGESLPMEGELAFDFEEMHRGFSANSSWIYDWPYWLVETDPQNAAIEARVRESLQRQMAQHPYTFEIKRLQRRFILYYSDGDYKTQQSFLGLAPRPSGFPFRRDGKLWGKYLNEYSALMRDAGVPFPKKFQQECGTDLRPLLYRGPAWLVKFSVDGQNVTPGCHVYVDDEGTFLCSSWCQRVNQRSKEHGISLQVHGYTFDGWVVGSAIQKGMAERYFTPRGATVKVFKPSDLKSQRAPEVLSFEQLLAKEIAKRPEPTVPVPSALELAYREAAGDTPAFEAVDAFLTALQLEGSRAAQRLPLPVTVPLATINEANHPYVERFRDGDLLRFETLTWPSDDAAHGPVGDLVCVTDARTYHYHFQLAQVALDLDTLRPRLTGYAETLQAERWANQPPPPISEALMAEVAQHLAAALAAQAAARRAARGNTPRVDSDGAVYRETETGLVILQPDGTTETLRRNGDAGFVRCTDAGHPLEPVAPDTPLYDKAAWYYHLSPESSACA